MKKLIFFTLIPALAFLCTLIGCQSPGGSAKDPTGKIVIYTSMYEEAIESIHKELQGKFPRCTVEFISRGTGIIEGLVNAEEASGKLGCDILMVAEPSYSLYLKDKRMLHSYKSGEAANLAFDYDPEGYWYPVRVSIMVMAYNPEKYGLDTIPRSYQGFAFDNGARGAISMRNPLVSGTTMATIAALRDKYGYEYYDGLGRQRVMIDYGSAETIRRLDNGQCRVVMILEESILRKRQNENSKLAVIYPSDGAVVIPSTIMIINNEWSANRNIPAAETIAEWFLGPEGQDAIVAGWMHSVRADFTKKPYDSKPTREIMSNSIPINWEEVYRQRDEIRNSFEDRVYSQR